MIKLLCDLDSMEDLSRAGLLQMESSDRYFLLLKTDSNGINKKIPVELNIDDSTSREGERKYSINDFLELFPTPSEVKKNLGFLAEGYYRTLRSGDKAKMQKALNNLLKKYSREEIELIVRYEVQSKYKASKANNRNEFQYMPLASSWLNNDARIEALYEECISKAPSIDSIAPISTMKFY